MDKPIVYDQFNRPDFVGEINSGEKIVETAGYVPANILIENMVYAGERLDIARSEMYDFPDEDSVEEGFNDITRSPGFDPADAHFIARAANGRIAEQRALYEKEKAARESAEQKAQSDSEKS